MSDGVYDLAVVGGGINGCGIARDAQGRGLRVILVEAGDLAAATSSASTKLIHGGLRYLEFYKFGYVREALDEREVLLNAAPHLVRPIRFILPAGAGRPWPLLRAGLFLYDHLGRRRILPPTRTLDLRRDPAGETLRSNYRTALEYSDCTVDDARLVVANARGAADLGADVRTRTGCTSARRGGGLWRLALEDQRKGRRFEVAARALVNATGPWVAAWLQQAAGLRLQTPVRLVKGSHIVIDRVLDRDRAFTLQNSDGRVCFAIPYGEGFTLIGSTDEDFAGDPGNVAISGAETDSLMAAANRYLRDPIAPPMIRWSYAGVRPLADDGAGKPQEVTREYVLEKDAPPGEAPLVSVIGGKITTYRRLAEAVLAALGGTFPAMRPAWTRGASLPGGDVPAGAFPAWVDETAARYGFLDGALVRRLCRAYGTEVTAILSGVSAPRDLGRDFGAGLSAREVAHLTSREWAETADDILWRRSKLGLHFTPQQRAALAAHLEGGA